MSEQSNLRISEVNMYPDVYVVWIEGYEETPLLKALSLDKKFNIVSNNVKEEERAFYEAFIRKNRVKIITTAIEKNWGLQNVRLQD